LDLVIEQVEPPSFVQGFSSVPDRNNYAVFAGSKTSPCTCKNSFKTIVLISPVMEIPAELDKEITVINFRQPLRRFWRAARQNRRGGARAQASEDRADAKGGNGCCRRRWV